jgi:hypothetical protein
MSIRAPYRNCWTIGLSGEMKITACFAVEPRDATTIATCAQIA